MPWKENTVMSKRESFTAEALLHETSFAALCRRYGISRKTGYKWLDRAREGLSLEDQSRQPHHSPGRTPPEMEALILDARDSHPGWGPRKLEAYLHSRGHEELPCTSTIGKILKRGERIDPVQSEKHTPWNCFEREAPNELWQMDFKGDFNLLDGSRCYPLTILDDHTRFSLCLEAMENQRYTDFYSTFSRVLSEYGLPEEILCDHGKPWSDGKSGITAFDVWMMQLGILPIHGKVRHPQTQGKEERFHRTLKNELLRHRPLKDLADAQSAFDLWRLSYNTERPHEALGMDCPVKYYRPSPRSLPSMLREPEYGSGENVRKVNVRGYLSYQGNAYFLSESLIGKYVTLSPGKNETMTVHYGDFCVARLGLREHTILSRHITHSTKV